jgi:hypothetical protein
VPPKPPIRNRYGATGDFPEEPERDYSQVKGVDDLMESFENRPEYQTAVDMPQEQREELCSAVETFVKGGEDFNDPARHRSLYANRDVPEDTLAGSGLPYSYVGMRITRDPVHAEQASTSTHIIEATRPAGPGALEMKALFFSRRPDGSQVDIKAEEAYCASQTEAEHTKPLTLQELRIIQGILEGLIENDQA